LLGFFIFLILLVIQNLDGGSIFKNLSKFSRGPFLKIN
jgi:hypothetical protein